MPAASLFVQLLAHTPEPEAVIAMGARLCYSGANVDELHNKVTNTDQTAFLKKLVDIGHLSPVEHASFTFGVEGVSRSLLAQLTRHRIASFSVQSQRYVKQTGADGFSYIMPPAIAKLGVDAAERYDAQMNTIHRWYDEWIRVLGNSGEKANEDARFVLPNAAETRLLVTMNARELQHLFRVRCCSRAQWEIRAMAWAMLGHCLSIAPNAFSKSGPSCVDGPCTEGAMSCGKGANVRDKQEQLKKFVQENMHLDDFARRLSAWAAEYA